MATVSNPSLAETNKFVIDDDEKLLNLVVSNPEHGLQVDVLKSFGARFRDDPFCVENDSSHKCWEGWIQNVQSLGFSFTSSKGTNETNLSANYPDTGSFPVDFENEKGQLHLEATSSILSISKIKAVQLTLATMRSLHTAAVTLDSVDEISGHQSQALLGTRVLLEKVTDHYNRQQLARLSLISEFLRSKQQEASADDNDGKTSESSAKTSILDSLDSHWKIDGKDRGIFQILLLVSCQKQEVLCWAQLLPAEKLLSSTSQKTPKLSSAQDEFGGDATEQAEWNQFMRGAISRKMLHSQRLALEALEVLLVLLYNRIALGVCRSDLAIILTAFKMQDYFQASQGASRQFCLSDEILQRQQFVSGLILTEVMALWRIFCNPSVDQSKNWVANHPLLSRTDNSSVELNALVTLIERSCSENSSKQHPESLGMLAFGLLLHAAGMECTQDESWSDLSRSGMELSVKANSDFDAFSYFHNVMETLVIPPAKRLVEYNTTTLTNMEGESSNAVISSPDLSAPSIIYASIGRELLTASIHSFQSKILPDQLIPDRGNIELLCTLASAIFCNSTTMCEQFWVEWEAFLRFDSPSPLCSLLKGAHKLACVAVSGQISDEDSILSVMPFLQLVSSLTNSIEVAEDVLLSILPNGLIRLVINILASSASKANQSKDFRSCRDVVLNSVSTLASMGNSVSCRDALRAAIEGGNATSKSSGLHNIFRIIPMLTSQETSGIFSIFSLISDLIVDASLSWLIEVIGFLTQMQSKDDVWHSLLRRDSQSTRAIVTMLNGLINRMYSILLDPTITEHFAIEFINLIRFSVHSLSSLLVCSISKFTDPIWKGIRLNYCTIAAILKFLNNTLTHLGIIIDVHQSKIVQQTTLELIDSLISALSRRKGLGEAVFSFATAPISLNIATYLEAIMKDTNVIDLMLGKESESATQSLSMVNDFGTELTRLSSFCTALVSKMKCDKFDFEAIKSKGWFDDDDEIEECLGSAYHAIHLLNNWAKIVENRIKSVDNSPEKLNEILMVSPHLLLGHSANWPREIHVDFRLSRIFATVEITNLDMLCVYMRNCNYKGIGFEPFLVMEVFDFMSQCLIRLKTSLNVRSEGYDDFLLQSFRKPCSLMDVLCGHTNSSPTAEENELFRSSETENSTICLHSLRTLAVYIDLNPYQASKHFSAGNGQVFGFLSDSVKNITLALKALKTETTNDSKEANFLIKKLRVGGCCLYIFRLLWKYARTKKHVGNDVDLDRWRNFVHNNSSLVLEIAKLLFDQIHLLSSTNADAGRYHCLLFAILSISLDVLSIEISWTLSNTKVSSDLPIVIALELVLEQSLSKIIDSVALLKLMSTFQSMSESYQSVHSTISILDNSSPGLHSILDRFRSTVSFSEIDIFVGMEGGITNEIGKWFASLKQSEQILPIPLSFFTNLGNAFKLFSCESRCLLSWKTFIQSFSVLETKWRLDLPNSKIFAMSDNSFRSSMIQELLKSMYESLQGYETSVLAISPSFLKEEALLLTRHYSGLILSFGQTGFLQLDDLKWVRLMDLVCKIAEIISTIDQVDNELFVSTLTQIFAVGILIVHSKPNSVKGYDTNQKSTPTSITMAIRACRVIRTIERIPINTETHIVCYCTFVSFISALIESADTEGNTFVARLCEVLQELDVVRSLVVQSNVLSLEDGNWTSSSYSNGIERLLSQNTTSAVLVTLHLFLRLATTGMVDMIRLLISNNAAQILWTKNIDANIQNQCRSKLSVLHGETTSVLDTLGNTLRTKVQFITVCLRSLNIWDTVQQDDSFLFIKAAIDFFHANQTSLLKCIENCITMIDSKQRVLTPEALIDAEHALSLIAELCTHRTLEILQRESVEVVFIIRKYALFVVATLGNFLGASAASREIFRATDNMVNEQSRGLVNAAEGGLIGPDQRLFAGGFQNATHEAIRYSHFVSKFLPKILSLDFGTEVLAGSASTRRSMSSLESACRVAVTKDFELIESQASKTLFSALRFLLQTHPAANCFVLFSVDEAARLDAMRFVNPGAIIGFRRQGVEAQDICFGQVISCDTIRRQWHVKLESVENDFEVVQESMIACIEDLTKRTTILACTPAPESSGSLETFFNATSIGHLILSLRWCCQFYSELLRNNSIPSEFMSSTVRLAELLSSLLGTEISIGEEIRKKQTPSQFHLDVVLANQLLDLFGDLSDFGEYVEYSSGEIQRDGRLKKILTSKGWNTVRNQLGDFLSLAVTRSRMINSNPSSRNW